MTDAMLHVQEVCLREELEYLKAYLDIEQVHFGDRLHIDYQIDPSTYDALVPSLILQPLAENAIRHGLEPQAKKGRLTVEAACHGETLMLAIRDSGRGLEASGAGRAGRAGRAGGAGRGGGAGRPFPRINGGVGLSNTRARLQKLYREDARLELSPNANGGAVATVTLPLRTA